MWNSSPAEPTEADQRCALPSVGELSFKHTIHICGLAGFVVGFEANGCGSGMFNEADTETVCVMPAPSSKETRQVLDTDPA
jgi:hypothetical protein